MSHRASSQTPDGRAAHAGRLTSAMAAVAPPTSARALRVGLVCDGRVLEERLLEGGAVTLGTDPRCTFVTDAMASPTRLRVFERKARGHRLRFTEAMSGRLALGGTVHELAALRARARRRRIDGVECWELVLDDAARGRITLGTTILLFEVTAVLPAQGRAQLPTAVKARLADDLDWPTTFVAAFSFLLHFGAVGATYSDWMDGIVDDDVYAAQLVQSLRALPTPPAVEMVTEVSSAAATAPSSAPAPAGAPGAATGAAARGAGAPGRLSDGAAAGLSAELARLDLGVLGAIGAGRSATDGVLRGGETPTGLLDQAASDAAGAGAGRQGGLVLGGETGLVPRGAGGFERIGNVERTAPTGTGASTRPQAPRGGVHVDPAPPSGCEVSNAAAVVASLAGRFRVCYQRGLTQEDPAMSGSMRITARIGPNGEVTNASVSSVSGLSPTVSSCIADRVRTAQFAAPVCGGATLVIPVRVFPQ